MPATRVRKATLMAITIPTEGTGVRHDVRGISRDGYEQAAVCRCPSRLVISLTLQTLLSRLATLRVTSVLPLVSFGEWSVDPMGVRPISQCVAHAKRRKPRSWTCWYLNRWSDLPMHSERTVGRGIIPMDFSPSHDRLPQLRASQ